MSKEAILTETSTYQLNAMMIQQGAAGVRVGHFETNFGGVRGEHCPSKQTSIILNII